MPISKQVGSEIHFVGSYGNERVVSLKEGESRDIQDIKLCPGDVAQQETVSTSFNRTWVTCH